MLTATAVVHYNSEACATNAVVTEAHIPAGPDLHMLVFLGYMAVRMLYMPVISALYLVCVSQNTGAAAEIMLPHCSPLSPP